MPSARPVLDTNVLRHFTFAHPDGIEILLSGVNNASAYFPKEVYNQDEAELPLESQDETLSEFARGLRYAKRRAMDPSNGKAQRYHTWLINSQQLPRHFARGSLIIDPLGVDELPLREQVTLQFGIAKGEAACLVLAKRYAGAAVFSSMDKAALRAANQLQIPVISGHEVLKNYVRTQKPAKDFLRSLLEGFTNAGYEFGESETRELISLL